MSIVTILHVIGALLVWVGLIMLLPLATAVWYMDSGIIPFASSMCITVFCGLLLFFFFKKSSKSLTHREGIAITAFAWLACALFGALPYLFSGTVVSFVDAFFESMSGFSTTGSTIYVDVEILPRSLLMWRALTVWLGGMGIIIFSLAILPFLGFGGMELFKAEIATPVPDKLLPRIQDTAILLWKIYILFSIVLFFLLLLGDLEPFHALTYTLSTVAAGGFTPHNKAVGHYSSVYVHWVIMIFMFLSATSFALHVRMLQGEIGAYWRNTEFRVYIFLIFFATILCFYGLYGKEYASAWDAFHNSIFHVVSMCSSTGFTLTDFTLWPVFPQMIMFMFLLVGGCAGSTSGGVKVLRYVLLFKHIKLELFRIIHPRVVQTSKINNVPVPAGVMSAAMAFLGLFFLLAIAISLLLAALGLDLTTAISGTISCLGNVGTAFGALGPAYTYAELPDAAKIILALTMLLGRLEICTIFILLVPEFWRK